MPYNHIAIASFAGQYSLPVMFWRLCLLGWAWIKAAADNRKRRACMSAHPAFVLDSRRAPACLVNALNASNTSFPRSPCSAAAGMVARCALPCSPTSGAPWKGQCLSTTNNSIFPVVPIAAPALRVEAAYREEPAGDFGAPRTRKSGARAGGTNGASKSGRRHIHVAK